MPRVVLLNEQRILSRRLLLRGYVFEPEIARGVFARTPNYRTLCDVASARVRVSQSIRWVHHDGFKVKVQGSFQRVALKNAWLTSAL